VAVGHVDFLAKNPEVDIIFLIRPVAEERLELNCPYMLGYPDYTRMLLKEPGRKIRSLQVEFRLRPGTKAGQEIEGIFKSEIAEIAEIFGVSYHLVRKEFFEALKLQKEHERQVYLNKLLPNGLEQPESPKFRVLALGHSYNLWDNIMSHHIVSKIIDQGGHVTTKEMLDKELLSKCAKRGLPKELFWTQSKHLAGAALQAMNTGSVDGIMFIQSFGCGPDATITPLLAREAKKAKMPFSIINIDVQTADAGIDTRVEATADALIEDILEGRKVRTKC